MMHSTQQLQPVRQSYWENKPTWTVYEFVFLINGLEPVQIDELKGIDEFGIRAKLADWSDCCRGCPGILATDRHPMDAPINKSVLICWASELSGVNIPTWIHEILEKPKINDLESESIPLGKREKDTHLFIIAALADRAKISLDEHYSAAKIIQDHLADLGVERAENTIASKLKEARLLLDNF